MNVLIELGDHTDVDADVLRAAVAHTVAVEGTEVSELSLTLLGDGDIREINRTYLHHDRPTDVLAFALADASGLVGDVYVGVDQARRQARDHGVPFEEELLRLVVHGTLHVLGHDHPEGEERYRSAMFELQERIVRDLTDEAGS